MSKLIARILFIPVNAFILYILIGQLRRDVSNLTYFFFDERSGVYEKISPFFSVFTVIFFVWIISHFVLEIAAYFKKQNTISYWLKHLRYAPTAVLIFSIFITISFDMGMIANSKRQIRNFVYDDSQPIEYPEFALHNDYRGWCGNGYISHRSYLYLDTATEGLNNENPQVRARALLMTYKVADLFFNGTDREQFDEVLRKSCLDSSSIVVKTAEDVLKEAESNCKNFLSSK
jgi:hypothetical protein